MQIKKIIFIILIPSLTTDNTSCMLKPYKANIEKVEALGLEQVIIDYGSVNQQEPQKKYSFDILPDELIKHIMEFLKFYPDMVKLKQVNKKYYKLFNSIFDEPNIESNRLFNIPVYPHAFKEPQNFNNATSFLKKLSKSEKQTERNINIEIKCNLQHMEINQLRDKLYIFKHENNKTSCFDHCPLDHEQRTICCLAGILCSLCATIAGVVMLTWVLNPS